MQNAVLTRNQSLVLDILLREQGPLSAYTILDRLREKGLKAPLQIYRALDKLTQIGRVHRLESVNAFVACRHFDEKEHNHGLVAFAICKKCSTVIEFSDEVMAAHVKQQMNDLQFLAQGTILEISGLCHHCAD